MRIRCKHEPGGTAGCTRLNLGCRGEKKKSKTFELQWVGANWWGGLTQGSAAAQFLSEAQLPTTSVNLEREAELQKRQKPVLILGNEPGLRELLV